MKYSELSIQQKQKLAFTLLNDKDSQHIFKFGGEDEKIKPTSKTIACSTFSDGKSLRDIRELGIGKGSYVRYIPTFEKLSVGQKVQVTSESSKIKSKLYNATIIDMYGDGKYMDLRYEDGEWSRNLIWFQPFKHQWVIVSNISDTEIELKNTSETYTVPMSKWINHIIPFQVQIYDTHTDKTYNIHDTITAETVNPKISYKILYSYATNCHSTHFKYYDKIKNMPLKTLSWDTKNGKLLRTGTMEFLYKRMLIKLAPFLDMNGKTYSSFLDENVLEMLLVHPTTKINSYLLRETLDGAVKKGLIKTVKVFLPYFEKMELNNKQQNDILKNAIGEGHTEIVKLLITKIDLNIQSNDGSTALMVACEGLSDKHEEIVNLLLKHNDIDVNKQDDGGWTALLYAIEMFARGEHNERNAKFNEKIIELLLNHNDIDVTLSDNRGNTPLMMASSFGHKYAVDLLLKKNFNDFINTQSARGTNSLQNAIEGGHFEIAKTLLKHNIDINTQDNKGRTPLFTIVYSMLDPERNSIYSEKEHRELLVGYKEFLKIFLERKDIGINKKDSSNRTVLYYTIAHKNKEVLELLLERKDIDVNVKFKGITTLTWASIIGHTEIVKLLLQHPKIDLNIQDKYGGNTALIVASYKGHTEIVKLLLQYPEKIDLNIQEKDGNTALILASIKGHTDTVKLLLQYPEKIDLNIKNKKGDTALELASKKGHNEIVYLLLQQMGKSIDVNKLMFELEKGDEKLILHVLKMKWKLQINKQNRDGETLLSVASRKGYVNIVKLLLENYSKSIDVNITSYQKGYTSLMSACVYGHNKIVNLLLGYPNININKQDSKLGNTAFMFAVKLGHIDIVKSFLNAKKKRMVSTQDTGEDMKQLPFRSYNDIDLNMQNADKKTAFILAIEKKKYDIILLLLNDENININIEDEFGNTGFSRMLLLFNQSSDKHTNVHFDIISLFLNRPSLTLTEGDKERLLEMFMLPNRSSSHFNFMEHLLETKHMVIPERTKQDCLQRATRDCNVPLITLLTKHLKHKPVHTSRDLLDCVLREDRNRFLSLTNNARLDDILFSFLYSNLFTHSNKQDLTFLIRATQLHDFKSHKKYVSEKHQKIQQRANYIVDMIYKKNKTINEKMTISLVFELMDIDPESLLDIKKETESFNIIDNIIITNMNKVKTLQKDKKHANELTIEALSNESERIIDKIYLLLKIRTGLFSKARKHIVSRDAKLNPHLQDLISKYI